jgi:cysteine-rich repeat protein
VSKHLLPKNLSYVALPAVLLAALVTGSCAPSPTTQTVGFVLNLTAKRVNRIQFVVSYADGGFAGTDGECVVGSASSLQAADPAVVSLGVATPNAGTQRALVATTTTTASSSTTVEVTTTAPPTTTTMGGPTTTVPTTTLAPTGNCGDAHIDSGEECDDGNLLAGDGCDATCHAEFSFTSIVDEQAASLTVTIVNGLGISPGSVLARRRFQGDIAAANLTVATTSCGLAAGGTCNPTTNGGVTVSTTTTTTTTTTSTTKTTTTVPKTTTTSTLQ